MPLIYEVLLNDIEKGLAVFQGNKEEIFFSIPSITSMPLDLRALDHFDKSHLIPHIRCKDYSNETTREIANLAKEMGFKKAFLISGDSPHPHQDGLTSCEAIPFYHSLGIEVGSGLDIYAACLKTEINKAHEKIRNGATYLVTQVVFVNDETEKRLLEIQQKLHHTGIKIYPCLSLLGNFEKDRHLLKKICPSMPKDIFSGKRPIEENNKKAVEIFQRLFHSDTTYLFQLKTT